MQLSGLYSTLSDSAIDAAYEKQAQVVKAASGLARAAEVKKLVDLGLEITDRNASVWSFAGGFIGSVRFPKYDAIQRASGGFSQTQAAQESVAASVKEVKGDITTAIKWGVGGAIGLGVAALVALYLLRRK